MQTSSISTPALLDMAAIPPPERHAAVVARFDLLAPGASFVLQLDHEPGPLLTLLQTEQPGRFEWSPLEEGPARWRIEIARRAAPPEGRGETGRRVTEALAWDHDRLDALAQAALGRRAENDFTAAAALWSEFAHGLSRHIGFEEALLFPCFEKKTGMPPNQGPTAVMRDEHQRIKALLAAISQRIGDAALPVDGLWRELLAVLGDHNNKEEMIIYPSTEQLLSPAENDAFVRDVQAFRR